MASTGVGERLQNARTARGLTLDDIEAVTRIKRRYLDALEREAWDELPAPAYARGFLAAYARQLGLPPDEIVGQYRSEGASEGAPRSPGPKAVEVRITPGAPQSRLRRIVTTVAVVLIAGTIVLTYVLVGQLRQFAATRPRPGVTANPSTATPAVPRAPSAVTPATAPVGTPAPPGQPAAPAGSPPSAALPAPAVPGAVVVAAQATDRSWVRVVSDGAVVFEGFVSAGDHQTWQGRQVSVRIGNASALDLSVNGRPVGRLGNPGDVVDRTFTGTPAATPNTPAAPPPAAPAPAPAAPPAPPARPAPPAVPGNTAPVSPGPSTGPPPPSPPANVHQ
ncbi:MAG TPA: RodZ domain-containing protein [bacterium]|nr:RodZ domain-containing protein [bacterium]